MNTPVYLNDLGILNTLAAGKDSVLQEILTGSREGFAYREVDGEKYPTAMCTRFIDGSNTYQGNRMLCYLSQVCEEIRPTVEVFLEKYGSNRIGVILGSTDNGSEQSLQALKHFNEMGQFPPGYTLEQQQAHYPADFVKQTFGLDSFSTSISTACTSSATAIILGCKMLELGALDAVIVGGADIVSDAVLKGFISLAAVDTNHNNPFSKNRKGINLGEGAALFVMSRDTFEDHSIQLSGYGESSDAHHMTAPDPQGTGAAAAMADALSTSNLKTVDYINLHGTGTRLNDRMESLATHSVFKDVPLLSSTKPMVGHTLGAAGAMELGFCWLLLSDRNKNRQLPPHLWDGETDEDLFSMNFVEANNSNNRIVTCMSNSYAFGGCNVSLIVTRGV